MHVQSAGGVRGWMMFDVSAIPNDATITSITLKFYFYDTSFPYVYANSAGGLNPTTASASDLFSAIGTSSSPYYTIKDLMSSNIGWRSYALSSDAISNLQSNGLTSDYFTIGFYAYESSSYYCYAYGYNNTNYKPYIEVGYTYTPTDPYIALDPTEATLLLDHTTTLTATVGNVTGTPTITYTSSNEDVATVSGSGTTATVTAVAEGTTTITATMNYGGTDYTSTCDVTVIEACQPTWTGSSSYYISNFTVTSSGTSLLNNSSTGTAFTTTNYYATKSITAKPGDELTCTITMNSSGTYGFALWVDFDDDGLEASDKVFGTTGYKNSPYTGTFTIPTNTPAGEYRLRILGDYNSPTPSDPCGSYQNGEAEDYKLIVYIPEYPKPVDPHLVDATGTTANIAWTAPVSSSHTISGYSYNYKKQDETIWSADAITTNTSAPLEELTALTDYDFRVKALYDSNTQESEYATTTFSTTCPDNYPLNYFCGFEGPNTTDSNPLPMCWTRMGTSTTYPYISTSNTYEGTHSLYLYKSSSHSNIMVALPDIDANLKDIRVVFYGKLNSASTDGTINIGYVDNTSTFHLVGTKTLTTSYERHVVSFSNVGNVSGNIAIQALYSSATASIYIDNVLVEPIPSCLEPTLDEPTGITATTATLQWTQEGDVSSWNIRWRENGSTGDYQTATSNTTSYQITTGLSGNKTYEYGVQAGCGSNWSDGTFTTSCPEFTEVPFTQNFDGIAGSTSNSANNLPQCWDYSNESTYSSNKNYPIVYSGSYFYYNSPNSLKFYITQYYSSYDPQPQYAILPAVQNVNGLRMKLHARAYSTSSSYTNTFKVGVMEGTDVSTFESIETITPTSTTYKEYIIPFDSYTGEGTRIAILVEVPSSTYDYAGVYIDNITVEQIPDCATPTDLAYSNTTPEGATITWAAGEGNEWTVQYKKTAESEWTTVTPDVTEATHTFTGLDFGTSYQARVSVVCTEGTGITYPTDPVSFTTKEQFPAPTDLVVSNLTISSATLSWTPGYTNQTAWKVQYKKSSDSWTDAATIVNTPTLDIPDGLEEKTTYNVRIYGGIGETFGTSSLTSSFTTKDSQGAPTDLVVSVTPNSATLSWTPGYTTQDHWTVKYKKSSVSSWDDATTENVTEPTIPLENLDGMTKYDVQIYYVEANKLTGSFTTAGAFPYTEDFTDVSSLPNLTGWNVYTGQLDETHGTATLSSSTTAWNATNTMNFSGEYHIYSNVFSTNCYKWAVSPTLYCSAEAFVKFDLALTKYNNENNQPAAVDPTSQQDDKFIVLITKDNGATWTQLAKWDNAGSERVYNDIATSWEAVTLNINESYAGEYIRIAFYGESTVSGGDNNVHIDNIEIDIVQDCDKPVLTLDDYAATTADFSWSAGESSTTWTLNYKKTTDEGWTVIPDITTNSYQIPELTPEQEYQVRVLASCNIYWSNTVTFTTTASCVAPVLSLTAGSETAVGATVTWTGDNDSYVVEYREVITPAVVFDETYGFEDGTLQGWTTISNDNDNTAWAVSYGSSNAHNSNYCVYSTYTSSSVGGDANDWLISPQIPLGGSLSFYAKRYSTSYPDKFQVYVSTTDNNISSFTAISDVITPNATYGDDPYEYDLSAYSGYGYVAIVYTAPNNQYYVYVDDIHITCSIDGEYGAWQQVSDANPTSPYTFDILDDETTYEVRVKGACGSEESDWSNTVSFTTLETCPAPTNFVLGEVTASTAAFSWTQTGGITTWNIWVKESTDAEYPTDYITASNTPSLTIDEDLSSNTTYDVKIAPACDHDKYLEVLEAFTTLCDPETVTVTEPFTEDFDDWTTGNYEHNSQNGVYPDCWYSDSEGSIYPHIINSGTYAYKHSGSYTMYFMGQASTSSYLALPVFTNDLSTLMVSFWMQTEDENTGSGTSDYGTLSLGYITDADVNYNTYQVIETYANHKETMVQRHTFLGDHTIPSNATRLVFRWQFGGSTWYGACIDDVRVAIAETFTKDITGYGTNDGGYVLLASPLADETSPADVANMIPTDPTDPNYDLYYFDQAQADEWRNYKAAAFNLENGTGYLYANKNDVTLTFSGVRYTGDGVVNLTYSTSAQDCQGWNLIGNPFATAATLDMSYYRLNSDGNGVNAETESAAVDPMEGIFVKASEAGQNVTFTPTTGVGAKGSQLNLNLSEGNNVVDNAIVRFDGGSTLEKFSFRQGSTKVFITEEGKDYAVVNAGHVGEIPVSFKAERNGSYTMSFTSQEVSFSYLHLVDNLTGNDVDLLANPSYTFNAQVTDFAQRFKLVFATGTSADGDSFGFINGMGNLCIFGIEGEATIQVIDILGHVITSDTFSGSYERKLNVAPGVYMIRLINGNDVKVQKMVVR